MAWRIHHQVIRGELDNRIQGKVTGTIWLAERPEPIRLTLQGDPWRDWAGCVLRFTHPTPQAGQLDGFTSDQTGVCGDMTASRKVRIAPEPVREWLEQGAPGLDSLPWGNSVYVEWFSEANGRVVIESTHFEVQISEPAWRMTEEEEKCQRERNGQAMVQFMARLQQAVALDLNAQGESTDGAPSAQGEIAEPNPSRTLDLSEKINDLRDQARELSGGPLIEGTTSPNLLLELQHDFWQHLVEFESASRRPRRELLAADGFHAPAVDGLSDEEIRVHLWGLIRALAGRRIFLESTNHLSDRELYTLLATRVLDEETQALPESSDWKSRICVDEYGVPGDDNPWIAYLTYYADEAVRAQWSKDFPGDLPPHRDPLYDRDRHLPR